MIRVVLEMCSLIGGGVERPNTTMASWASHFLVGMTTQSAFNREANPLATPFHFADIVADFTHLADICRLWAIRQAIWLPYFKLTHYHPRISLTVARGA